MPPKKVSKISSMPKPAPVEPNGLAAAAWPNRS
jgi:hypothetical protein